MSSIKVDLVVNYSRVAGVCRDPEILMPMPEIMEDLCNKMLRITAEC